MLTQEQVRVIAEKAAEVAAEKVAETAAEKAAEKAADRAIRATLTALGINPDKLHEEQQVWAFARTAQQGTARTVRAAMTGFFSTLATLIAGAIWYLFFNKHQ